MYTYWLLSKTWKWTEPRATVVVQYTRRYRVMTSNSANVTKGFSYCDAHTRASHRISVGGRTAKTCPCDGQDERERRVGGGSAGKGVCFLCATRRPIAYVRHRLLGSGCVHTYRRCSFDGCRRAVDERRL